MSSTEQGWPLRLDGVLARAALTAPAREAVAFDGRSWTYREVYDRARRLAGALAYRRPTFVLWAVAIVLIVPF